MAARARNGKAAHLVRPALAAFAFGNFAVAAAAFTLPGILAPVARGLDVSVVEAGNLLTIYAAAYAVGSPLLTALTTRLDRRVLLMTGLVLVVASNAMTAIATTYSIAVVSRILAACGAAIYTPVITYVVAMTSPPERRGRDLSIAFIGLSLAQVIGIPLATWIGFAFNWRVAFGVIAAMAAVALAFVAAFAPKGVKGQAMSGAAWAAFGKDWKLMLAVSVTALQMSGQFVVYTYIGPLLTDSVGFDDAGITTALIGFGLASIVGGLSGGWITDRVGSYTGLWITLGAMAIGIALLSPAHGSLPLTIVALIIWGVFGYAFTTPQQTRLIAVGAAAPGMTLAFNSSLLYVGTAVGGAGGGLIIATSGYAWLGWGGGALCAASLAALWMSRTPSDRMR